MPAVSWATAWSRLREDMAKPDSAWSRMLRGEKLPSQPKLPSRWDKRPDGRNVAHQYRPAFFSGFPDLEDVPFDTLDQLMAIEWVNGWKDQRLARFSITRDSYHSHALMAEMKNGKWWVVAHLDNDVPELPTWKMRKIDAQS